MWAHGLNRSSIYDIILSVSRSIQERTIDRRTFLKWALVTTSQLELVSCITSETNSNQFTNQDRPLAAPLPRPNTATRTATAITTTSAQPTVETVEKAQEPLTKQEIVNNLLELQGPYRDFAQSVISVYSESPPRTITINGVIMNVYPPRVEYTESEKKSINGRFKLNTNTDKQMPSYLLLEKFKLEMLLPYLNDDSSPYSYTTIIDDQHPFASGMEPVITLVEPQKGVVKEPFLQILPALRKFVVRKEALTFAGVLWYMHDMISLNSNSYPHFYMIDASTKEKVDIITHIYREATRDDGRLVALMDLFGAILAFKTFEQTDSQVLQFIRKGDPDQGLVIDLVQRSDFGKDPKEFVPRIFRFILDNKELLLKVRKTIGDFNKLP